MVSQIASEVKGGWISDKREQSAWKSSSKKKGSALRETSLAPRSIKIAAENAPYV